MADPVVAAPCEPSSGTEVPTVAASARLNLTRLRIDGRLDMSASGAGNTAARLLALFELARTAPVGLARLAEAHVDAVAILAEAGATPRDGSLYGVWASSSPGGVVVDEATWALNGRQPFASGIGVVDRALVAARTADGRQLLIDASVDPTSPTLHADTDGWATVALADTSTGSIEFDGHPVDARDVVGDPGWYLGRPGFWHGACGPAACWAGAAAGLVDVARELADDDPHRRAHLGAMMATGWSMRALLTQSGQQIDADPNDRRAAEFRARAVRQVIERSCADVLDRFSRSLGPRPFTSDGTVAVRFADAHLYLRQHHAERELSMIVEVGP